jgi:hypothetical protein
MASQHDSPSSASQVAWITGSIANLPDNLHTLPCYHHQYLWGPPSILLGKFSGAPGPAASVSPESLFTVYLPSSSCSCQIQTPGVWPALCFSKLSRGFQYMVRLGNHSSSQYCVPHCLKKLFHGFIWFQPHDPRVNPSHKKTHFQICVKIRSFR